MKKYTCTICNKKFDKKSLVPMALVNSSVWSKIAESHDLKNSSGYICKIDYQEYKIQVLTAQLEDERGRVSSLEKKVIDSFKTNELITDDTNQSFVESLTVGEKIADKVSSFGGSWLFVIIFFAILLGWMSLNTFILSKDQFDPYPYILLNLVLSCLAAIQAPIIMMTQNRRAERDRIEAENDYKVNLKAELQIRHINQKLEKLMLSTWQDPEKERLT